MTKKELEKSYYANRPAEPYCDDDMPSDWANIVHYAEENLEKAFEQIEELEKENEMFKKANEIIAQQRDGRDVDISILEKQIEKLKQQIEKMRNFENCDYQLHVVDCPIFKSGGHIDCSKCPHWILQDADNENINDKWHRQM